MNIRRILVGLCFLGIVGAAFAQRAFDVDILTDTFGFDAGTKRSVPLDKLMQGCPTRDCIPSIDQPKYVVAAAADHIGDDDPVITLSYKGHYWAFPTRILDQHEIVNDVFAGDPLAITWCPLCGSAVGIERTIGDTVTSFGVSGLLYNSDLVLYDRETATLWDQIVATGIVGPLTGEKLTYVPLSMSTWSKWRSQHPDTLVLSPDTGFNFDYSQDRYADYRASTRLFMPVSNEGDRLRPKTPVYGFELASGPVAYTASLLEKEGNYRHEVAGKDAVVTLGEDGAVTMQRDGEVHHPIRSFWFAWYTFHPDTELVD